MNDSRRSISVIGLHEIDLSEFKKAVWRIRYWMLLSLILSVLVCLVFFWVTPKQHKAFAAFKIAEIMNSSDEITLLEPVQTLESKIKGVFLAESCQMVGVSHDDCPPVHVHAKGQMMELSIQCDRDTQKALRILESISGQILSSHLAISNRLRRDNERKRARLNLSIYLRQDDIRYYKTVANTLAAAKDPTFVIKAAETQRSAEHSEKEIRGLQLDIRDWDYRAAEIQDTLLLISPSLSSADTLMKKMLVTMIVAVVTFILNLAAALFLLVLPEQRARHPLTVA